MKHITDTQDTLDLTLRVSDTLVVGQTTGGLDGGSSSGTNACGHVLLAAQDPFYPHTNYCACLGFRGRDHLSVPVHCIGQPRAPIFTEWTWHTGFWEEQPQTTTGKKRVKP